MGAGYLTSIVPKAVGKARNNDFIVLHCGTCVCNRSNSAALFACLAVGVSCLCWGFHSSLSGWSLVWFNYFFPDSGFHGISVLKMLFFLLPMTLIRDWLMTSKWLYTSVSQVDLLSQDCQQWFGQRSDMCPLHAWFQCHWWFQTSSVLPLILVLLYMHIENVVHEFCLDSLDYVNWLNLFRSISTEKSIDCWKNKREREK